MVSYLLLPYTIIVFSVEKQPCETYITFVRMHDFVKYNRLIIIYK